MESFSFNLDLWRAACISPIPPPAGVSIRCVLDSSPTANPQSDESALVCGFTTGYRESDGENELTLLDASADRWKGMDLASAAVRFVDKWKPTQLEIEGIPGTDLLRDAILLKGELDGVHIPHIKLLTVNSKKGAKENRIRRLQTLWGTTPPALRICRGGYVEKLFSEVERFGNAKGNHGRQDNLLDGLALLCGFR